MINPYVFTLIVKGTKITEQCCYEQDAKRRRKRRRIVHHMIISKDTSF